MRNIMRVDLLSPLPKNVYDTDGVVCPSAPLSHYRARTVKQHGADQPVNTMVYLTIIKTRNSLTVRNSTKALSETIQCIPEFFRLYPAMRARPSKVGGKKDTKLQVPHPGPWHPHRTEGSRHAAEDAGDVLCLPLFRFRV